MNSQQRAAACAPNGYIQIIAGPGTGKTFTLVHRIVELLRRGLAPARIVIVTFTRAAAQEVLARVSAVMESKPRIMIGTFHSVALRLLRRFGDDRLRRLGLVDEQEKVEILRGIDGVSGTNARRIAAQISRLQSQCDSEPPVADDALYSIYQQYERRLQLLNKTDFDGLLRLFAAFVRTNPVVSAAVDAVLVDEFQDTSLLQLDIAMRLARQCGNLTVVGDPDQSIYGFRNADMRNFVTMAQREDVTKWYLEKNYRSEQAILTAASRVIQHSEQRYARDRQLLAAKTAGAGADSEVQFVRTSSVQEEAQTIAASVKALLDCGVKGSEICLLSRYTSKFQSLEVALIAAGIPTRMVGGKRVASRRDVRLVVDYMRVVLDGNDALAVERTVNNPPRGLGEKSLLQARDKEGILTLDRIRRLCTDHSRKYTSIIDSARRLISPAPTQEGSSTATEAIAVVKQIAAAIFEPSNSQKLPDIDSPAAVLESMLIHFQTMYDDDMDEHDDRTFLQAFIDQWTLGVDAAEADAGSADSAGVQNTCKVTLSTIHSSKGLEWPVVYMVDVSEGDGSMDSKRDLDEERRLLYVAMTRAKCWLIVSCANAKAGFDKLLHVPRSAITYEISAASATSLSHCVGRKLKIEALAPRRSVLSQSKRFRAKAPVELPPGFQLASDLPDLPQQNLKPEYSAPPPQLHQLPRQKSAGVAKKPAHKQGKTLLSFWGAAPK